jgi:hypothetical protein
MTLSLSSNLSQNMQDSTIAMTLPDLNIAVSRFYPFKRKKLAGKQRWYEKISMTYTGQLSNSISTKEDKLLKSNLVKDVLHVLCQNFIYYLIAQVVKVDILLEMMENVNIVKMMQI